MEHVHKIELRKTRDFSEKVNVTFEFIRVNYKPLFTCILFISAPFSLIGMLLMSYSQNFIMYDAIGSIDSSGMISGIVLMIPAYILIIGGYLLNSSVINNFVRLYEEKDDPFSITVSEVWSKAVADIGTLLGASILVGIMVFTGFIFLIIPGVYLMVALSLIVPVIIIERKTVSDGISRCFTLIKDKWWSTFGLLFVMGILQAVIGLVFNIPTYVIVIFQEYIAPSSETFNPPLWVKVSSLLASAISAIGSNLVASLTSLAIVFQFFNLVERREATGFINKLENFGKQEENTGTRESF